MTLRKSASAIGALLIILGPILAYWLTELSSLAWLALVAASTFTVVTRLEDLTELSLGPLKARMRETLDEATATLAQLREVATITSRVVLTDLIADHFIDGMPLSKRLDLYDTIMASLDKIGASQLQKASAETEWRRVICMIYYHAVVGAVAKDDSLDQAKKSEMVQELRNMSDYTEWYAPPPQVITKFLSNRGYSSEDLDQWIADYRHFIECNEIRNRSKFVMQ
jgi:hypothetical protein